MANYEKPTTASVSSILSMVFGEDFDVKDDPAAAAESYVASYVDPEDKVVALCVCDRPFVAYSGAALSMIPAGAANDIIKGEDWSKTILDNYHEIMNICAKLMISESSSHLRLAKIQPSEETGELVSSMAAGQSCTFSVDIPRYGSGALTFMIAA